MIVKKTYTVWTLEEGTKLRLGRVFKSKKSADEYASQIPPIRYFGTTVSIKIIDDDIV